MKKVLMLLFVVVVVYAAAQAQDYKPVKIGIGLGYASASGTGASGGPIFYLEPAYRVNDKIALGLRLEGAVLTKGTTIIALNSSSINSVVNASSAASASYTVNGQYYFSNENFRPFAGVGLGIYSSASVSINSGGTGTSSSATVSGSQFGFYPRIGFDAGHFTMQVEYNIVPSTSSQISVTTTTGGQTAATSETSNSYLGIKAGFFFGGGKISK
jgi:outer membrane protein W